jgi:hypothetical protein
MSRTEEKLLNRARRQFGHILPCAGKTLAECFYYQNDSVQFWFNDASGNTHLVYIPTKEPG